MAKNEVNAAEEVAEEKVPARYIIQSKNEEYSGKTFGIRFDGGKALVDPATLPKHLSRDLETIVRGFKDMPGYEVIALE